MLGIDARHAVEEVALEAQGQRCAGLDDLLARALNINLLNGFPGDLARAATRADGREEPAVLLSGAIQVLKDRVLMLGRTYQMVATPCC